MVDRSLECAIKRTPGELCEQKRARLRELCQVQKLRTGGTLVLSPGPCQLTSVVGTGSIWVCISCKPQRWQRKPLFTLRSLQTLRRCSSASFLPRFVV